MKLCFTSEDNNLKSNLDSRFGRCKYFIIVDSDSEEYNIVQNEGATSPHGAGVAAAQQVVNENVDIVVTGNIGPNSERILSSANIKILKGKPITIEENIKQYKQNKLEELTDVRKSHFGLK